MPNKPQLPANRQTIVPTIIIPDLDINDYDFDDNEHKGSGRSSIEARSTDKLGREQTIDLISLTSETSFEFDIPSMQNETRSQASSPAISDEQKPRPKYRRPQNYTTSQTTLNDMKLHGAKSDVSLATITSVESRRRITTKSTHNPQLDEINEDDIEGPSEEEIATMLNQSRRQSRMFRLNKELITNQHVIIDADRRGSLPDPEVLGSTQDYQKKGLTGFRKAALKVKNKVKFVKLIRGLKMSELEKFSMNPSHLEYLRSDAENVKKEINASIKDLLYSEVSEILKMTETAYRHQLGKHVITGDIRKRIDEIENKRGLLEQEDTANNQIKWYHKGLPCVTNQDEDERRRSDASASDDGVSTLFAKRKVGEKRRSSFAGDFTKPNLKQTSVLSTFFKSSSKR